MRDYLAIFFLGPHKPAETPTFLTKQNAHLLTENTVNNCFCFHSCGRRIHLLSHQVPYITKKEAWPLYYNVMAALWRTQRSTVCGQGQRWGLRPGGKGFSFRQPQNKGAGRSWETVWRLRELFLPFLFKKCQKELKFNYFFLPCLDYDNKIKPLHVRNLAQDLTRYRHLTNRTRGWGHMRIRHRLLEWAIDSAWKSRNRSQVEDNECSTGHVECEPWGRCLWAKFRVWCWAEGVGWRCRT